MSVYVTVTGLREAAFGIDIPQGDVVDAALQRLIDKAETRLLAAFPSIPARIAAGTLSVDLVAGVVEDMVLRVASNPRGVRSLSIDDYTETLDRAVSSGVLYLSPEELALLAGPMRAGGAFGSIKLRTPAWWIR